MTGELLRTYTRKRLAAMARSRHVSGWHDMRKADLIEALIADHHRQELSPVSASHDGLDSDNDSLSKHQDSGTVRPPHWLPQTLPRVLLRTVGGDHTHFSATALNPHWIRAEWAVTRDALRRVERAIGPDRHQAKPVLRLYDVTDNDLSTHAITFVSDTFIPSDAREWFVQVDQPGQTYQLQLGILSRDGEFYRLESSNRINTSEPDRSHASPSVRHSPFKSLFAPHRTNGSTPTSRLPLTIDAELVIRGVTHPQAELTIANDVITQETDGSFEHSLPLPEGRHVVPTTVVDPACRQRRTVVLAVQRNTRYLDPQGPDDQWRR